MEEAWFEVRAQHGFFRGAVFTLTSNRLPKSSVLFTLFDDCGSGRLSGEAGSKP